MELNTAKSLVFVYIPESQGFFGSYLDISLVFVISEEYFGIVTFGNFNVCSLHLPRPIEYVAQE